MKYLRWLLLFAFASPLMAQNVRWDLPVYTTQAQGGNLLPVYAIPGALVSFYNEPAGTLANTYNSATSASPCPTSAQVVLNGSAACVSSADPYGNMGGWFQPGQYMASITAQGVTYNYLFTISGSGGGGGGGAIIDACQQSGADGGAKVNAALAALGGPGTVTIDLSCGTTWTTPVVATAAGQTLQFLGGTFNLPSISLPFASDTIDGNNSTTLQVQAYSSGTSGLIQFYSGANVGSSDVVQNITLDGNWANTPSANTCFPAACRPAIRITNGGNSSPVHDIQTHNVVFQNWNNPPVVVAGHGSSPYLPDYPLPYNIAIAGDGESCKFQNLGSGGVYIDSFDHNVIIRGCHFDDWGDGLTEYHADAITTNPVYFVNPSDSYPGTTDFGLDISGNIFDNTQLPSDGGWGYIVEAPAGGYQVVTDFKFTDNQVHDNGTGKGTCLSGIFNGAVIANNVFDAEGVCEGTGSNLTITGNTINGFITDFTTPLGPSTASTITGNTLTVQNSGLFNGTGAKTIQVSGGATQTVTLSQTVHQTAESFNIASGAVVFTPQTVAGTPPSVTVTSSAITGGSGNVYHNWAFTLFGANNSKNNGTFIITASTSNSVTFVNPKGVSETLPSGATLTSSATTTDYIGTLGSLGSFNGLAQQDHVAVTGFTNATNNTGATSTGTSYSWSASVGTVQSTNSWAAGQVLTVTETNPADIMYPFNGQEITVLSAGLSGSQFGFASGVGGSASTTATFTSIPLVVLANSMTVIATTNPSAVNETHAGTLTYAPTMYNANVGSNSINLAGANSDVDTCMGVIVGSGADGPGPVYNSKIHDNTVFAPNGFTGGCPGVFVPNNSGYAISGIEFTHNDFANIGYGYWFLGTGPTSDITIDGGKFVNVAPQIFNPNSVPLRLYNYVNSPTQTGQALQGGASVDATGGLHDGSASSQDVMLGNLSVNNGAAIYAPSPSSSALYVFGGAIASTYENVLLISPLASPIAAPVGTPSGSGGTIPASTTNFAYITCITPLAQVTAGSNKSTNVVTTGSSSSIAWAWTGASSCLAYDIWPATSGTPNYFFTGTATSLCSGTSCSYTQTAPASGGTAGTMQVGLDQGVASINGDGSFSTTADNCTGYGVFNAATNPIPAAGGVAPGKRCVSDAMSAYGTYTSGGTYTIPVFNANIGSGATWTSMLGTTGVGSTAFSALTSATNTSAAMTVGSGASMSPAGTGTIEANQAIPTQSSANDDLNIMMSNYDGTSDPTIYEDGDIFWNPALGILYLVSPSGVSGSQFILSNQNAASDATSQNAPDLNFVSRYCVGTSPCVSTQDDWYVGPILPAGSNPPNTFTFSHTGSSGTAAVSVPNLIVPGESSYSGYAMCYGTGGAVGHCTSIVGSGGTCTCAVP